MEAYVEHRTATSHTGVYLDIDRPYGEVVQAVDAWPHPSPVRLRHPQAERAQPRRVVP